MVTNLEKVVVGLFSGLFVVLMAYWGAIWLSEQYEPTRSYQPSPHLVPEAFEFISIALIQAATYLIIGLVIASILDAYLKDKKA
jgi:uncharacterized membrane protein YraQ (UPF0718 family)